MYIADPFIEAFTASSGGVVLGAFDILFSSTYNRSPQMSATTVINVSCHMPKSAGKNEYVCYLLFQVSEAISHLLDAFPSPCSLG